MTIYIQCLYCGFHYKGHSINLRRMDAHLDYQHHRKYHREGRDYIVSHFDPDTFWNHLWISEAL